ncbi:hypothetical protein [Gordonia sp. MP11Mi]|uniref:SRPBCC family protein n=1 Tax=Gordonia sp. MP11Mi TaxID=3022769 RepID=A0AA97CXD4_9ACTN
MLTIIIAVIACLLAAGVIGLGILAVLASGEAGPKRFATSEPASPIDFFTDASWAATVRVEVAQSPANVWEQACDGPLVTLAPIVSGPRTAGDERQYHGLIAATSRTVQSAPESGLIAVGTGVSIPIAVKSFAERIVITGGGGKATIEYTLAVQPRLIGFLPLRWTAAFIRPFMAFAVKRAF